jgi:FkbM family methyltransferase
MGAEEGLVPVRLHRFVFYVDPRESGEGLLFDSYEPATTFVFERIVAAGDVVADVGAHWGYFTLLAATLSGSTGRVVAFEPHPKNASTLAKNVKANRLGNVEIVQKAVSDREGFANLFLSRASSGNSLVSVPPGAEASADRTDHIVVETTTLDRFFTPPRHKPKLVKIDIEGAESAALDGMKTLIRETEELVLITELNPFYFPGAAGGGFLGRLADQGFDMAIIDDARFQIEVGEACRVARRALGKGYKVNLLCVRGSRVNGILRAQGDIGVRRGKSPKTVRL